MSAGSAIPSIATGFRLQCEPVQNAHVMLYPEGMVKLNVSAAEILRRCDGERSVAAIVTELEQLFNHPGLAAEVSAFLEGASRAGWVTLRPS